MLKLTMHQRHDLALVILIGGTDVDRSCRWSAVMDAAALRCVTYIRWQSRLNALWVFGEHCSRRLARTQVGGLVRAVQAANGDGVDLAYIEQRHAGDKPAAATEKQGITFERIKLPNVKRGLSTHLS